MTRWPPLMVGWHTREWIQHRGPALEGLGFSVLRPLLHGWKSHGSWRISIVLAKECHSSETSRLMEGGSGFSRRQRGCTFCMGEVSHERPGQPGRNTSGHAGDEPTEERVFKDVKKPQESRRVEKPKWRGSQSGFFHKQLLISAGATRCRATAWRLHDGDGKEQLTRWALTCGEELICARTVAENLAGTPSVPAAKFREGWEKEEERAWVKETLCFGPHSQNLQAWAILCTARLPLWELKKYCILCQNHSCKTWKLR